MAGFESDQLSVLGALQYVPLVCVTLNRYERISLTKHACVCCIDAQPSRKKLFSEVRINEDRKIYETEVHGKKFLCAKVYNPAIFFMKKGNSTWSEFTDIQRLEIEDHEGILSTIPKELLTELHRLESLTVNWTKIRSLPERLFQLPLNSLYLQRNQIRSLAGVDRAAATLTILDVSNNCIDSVPKTFGELTNLVTLNLSGNNLRELPDSISLLVMLRTLDVSSNKLGSLPSSIGNIINLTSLDVCNNQLVELPESLTGLPNLEDLRASGNRLASLPDAFRRLVRLNSLLLRGNQFTAVPDVLADLTNLSTLNMRDNSVTRMQRPIRSLRCLVLDHNQLELIDEGILGCVNLQLLSLQNNKLTKIPVSITRLQNLRTLILSENAVSSVPVELAQISRLGNLGLRATRVATIPIEVAEMSSLTTLDLDDCDQLEPYVKLAYKDGGLPRIVEYLRTRNNEDDLPEDDQFEELLRSPVNGKLQIDFSNCRESMVPDSTEIAKGQTRITKKAGAHVSLMPTAERASPDSPGKPMQLMGLNESSRHTLWPDDEAIDNTVLRSAAKGQSSRRHEAGLSIVAGRSMMLDDEDQGHTASGKPQASTTIRHLARNTLLPESVHAGVGNDGRSELGPGGVICTLENFGDLVSSSIDDSSSTVAVASPKGNKPAIAAKPAASSVKIGGGTVSGTRKEEDQFDDEDLSQLYAKVSKKTNAVGDRGTDEKKQPNARKSAVRFANQDQALHTLDYND
jgi:Leucine-rich repeat (LRR) protein